MVKITRREDLVPPEALPSGDSHHTDNRQEGGQDSLGRHSDRKMAPFHPGTSEGSEGGGVTAMQGYPERPLPLGRSANRVPYALG